jgi:hypothetical protein
MDIALIKLVTPTSALCLLQESTFLLNVPSDPQVGVQVALR